MSRIVRIVLLPLLLILFWGQMGDAMATAPLAVEDVSTVSSTGEVERQCYNPLSSNLHSQYGERVNFGAPFNFSLSLRAGRSHLRQMQLLASLEAIENAACRTDVLSLRYTRLLYTNPKRFTSLARHYYICALRQILV
ncbi:MAG: hypothetical protein LBN29_14215 [Mediterranea sp.]|jgi:hypothetical protein|nr:hypothetical protein [Mediterranea sp.]